VALGACAVEKHFTLDRLLPGPDHKASLVPGELSALVLGIRAVEAALGDGNKAPSQYERRIGLAARKSLVAGRDLRAGTRLSADMLVAKRPGTGISPSMLESVVGRKLAKDINAGSLLTWDAIVS
jgi:N,N'-diacetyllegionaminate synthase